MADRKRTLPRSCGCIVLPFFLVAIFGSAFALAWLIMSGSHNVSRSAEAMGMEKGPSYGWDGWWLGDHDGAPVAVAATYHFYGGPSSQLRRQKRDETIEVATVVAGRVGGRLEWDGEQLAGEGRLGAVTRRQLEAFARSQGSLVVADVGEGPWPFEEGVVLAVTWRQGTPSVDDLDGRLDALVTAARDAELGSAP